MKTLKIFSCNFTGFWPVGACAVIVAASHKDALRQMTATVKEMRLAADNPELVLEEIDLRRPCVRVLLDGSY